MRSWLVALSLLTMLFVVGTVAEPTRASSAIEVDWHSVEKMRRKAMKAYHADDHATFARLMGEVAERTHKSLDLYNYACGLALTGRPSEALVILADLADRETGVFPLLMRDDDFDGIRGTDAFQEIVSRAAFVEKMEKELAPTRRRALEAHRAGNYQLFADMMALVGRYSQQDVDVYNLACGYALTGRGEEALDLLEQLVDRGADFGMAHDHDFEAIRDTPRFRSLLARAGLEP